MAHRKTDTLHRLLDIAAQLFIEHRYENVSVNAIARAARCSTATIYEIYVSKEGLLLSVMRERLLPQPTLVPVGAPGFHTLLLYIESRLDVIHRTGHDGLLRTVLRQPDAVGEMFARFAQANRDQHQTVLIPLIEASVADGMLRPNPTDVILDHIEAMVHMPALQMLLLGVETLSPATRILRQLFIPLASEQGLDALEHILQARGTGEALRTSS